MLGSLVVWVVDCRSDAPASNPAGAIMKFYSLNHWRDLDFHEHFIKQKFQETEILCRKREMSCESHWGENVILDYGQVNRRLRGRDLTDSLFFPEYSKKKTLRKASFQKS